MTYEEFECMRDKLCKLIYNMFPYSSVNTEIDVNLNCFVIVVKMHFKGEEIVYKKHIPFETDMNATNIANYIHDEFTHDMAIALANRIK